MPDKMTDEQLKMIVSNKCTTDCDSCIMTDYCPACSSDGWYKACRIMAQELLTLRGLV